VARRADLKEPRDVAAQTTSAIVARGVSKEFTIPHDKRMTLKEYFLHPFTRTTYEVNRALDDVSFTVERGEFFGVIGPNGSGKTTLLKLLAGILRPTSGDVGVNGALSPFLELGVGFNPALNARDNVLVNGTLLGMTPKDLRRYFDDIIAFAELERFVDQKLKNYSAGMQVRLAYAVAIHVPFDILLLDEVLAVGDQSFQEKCFATFEGFREERKTMVLVSHDLGSVARFCDRVLVLRAGRPAGIGPADEMIERYLALEGIQ
jgi:ABC-type polysaccharide/polyol phosphate transport system ATPase subunit